MHNQVLLFSPLAQDIKEMLKDAISFLVLAFETSHEAKEKLEQVEQIDSSKIIYSRWAQTICFEKLTIMIVISPREELITEFSGKVDRLVAHSQVVDFWKGRVRRLLKPEGIIELKDDADLSRWGFCQIVPRQWKAKGASKTEEKELKEQTKKVLIVGAGLSGAFLAYELSKRGWKISVMDKNLVPAAGASALYAGILHPHRQAASSPLTELTYEGYESIRSLLSDFPQFFKPFGVLDCATSAQEWDKWKVSLEKNAHPVGELLEKETAQAKAGVSLNFGGWWFKEAGMVQISGLVRHLLERSGASVLTNTAVHLEKQNLQWAAKNPQGVLLQATPNVVVASAFESASVCKVPQEWLGLSGLYGRISLVRDSELETVNCAITGQGYMFRYSSYFGGVGATYEDSMAPLSREQAHLKNKENISKMIARPMSLLWTGFYEGLRAVARDRMPLVGAMFSKQALLNVDFSGVPEPEKIPVEPGLYILAGMGSRGITWGYLLAQVLAAQMNDEPIALKQSLVKMLNPARFVTQYVHKRA